MRQTYLLLELCEERKRDATPQLGVGDRQVDVAVVRHVVEEPRLKRVREALGLVGIDLV